LTPDVKRSQPRRSPAWRAALYHFRVDTQSNERDAEPKPAEPKRDQPAKDERPVDDKTPVPRFG